MKSLKTLFALLFSLSLVAAACGSDDAEDAETTEVTEDAGDTETTEATEATEDEGAMEEGDEDSMEEGDETHSGDDLPETIVDIAGSDDRFTTLVTAVMATGLDETLAGEGPFTVFAPTDEAFEAALAELGTTVEELVADQAKLEPILTYHVIPDEVLSTDVVALDGQTAATVNGAEINVSLDGETVMLNETATVSDVDLKAKNGVVHVIDSVLLPPEG